MNVSRLEVPSTEKDEDIRVFGAENGKFGTDIKDAHDAHSSHQELIKNKLP